VELPDTEVKFMNTWMCKTCDYIYEEQQGDVDTGSKPGVKYEDLPADWACPDCGNEKNGFVKKDMFIFQADFGGAERALWQ
jgi:rubredoxin